jgi:predicted ABC-type transport system involved in lysophospholipase L1 biosynthesis ATPase subunit
VSIVLQAETIDKTFRRATSSVEVLKACSFTLESDSSVSIVGASGAGKSTLLNILSGLDAPDSGSLRAGERDLSALSRDGLAIWRREEVGFIFQFHFLLPDFSALENLLLPVRLDGSLHEGAVERAQNLLERMGLADRMDHLPGELSGGEQQRVAVARAFMNSPRIIMADEPFGNLDHQKGQELSNLLYALRAENKASLVVVTHDMQLAACADTILELRDGSLAPHTPV